MDVALATEAMGTRFELALGGRTGGGPWGEGAVQAHLRAAGEAALEEIQEAHRRLTRFERTSTLALLEREAARRSVRLDADTFELFRTCASMFQLTGGAFDVALRSEVSLKGPGFELDGHERSIRLERAGVRLDLGAIGKGHALDLAARSLRESGVERALLHGGTSTVLAIGRPSGSAGFEVLVPRDNREPGTNTEPGTAEGSDEDAKAGLRSATGEGSQGKGNCPGNAALELALCDRALSVSAQHGRRADAPDGHLVAFTSRGAARAQARAAVCAATATAADAWSTALAVVAHPAHLAPAWQRAGIEPILPDHLAT